MSSIQAAKAGIGYQTAGQRPSCCNCKTSAQREVGMRGNGGTTWYCTRFCFMTTAMATCFQHTPKFQSQPGDRT